MAITNTPTRTTEMGLPLPNAWKEQLSWLPFQRMYVRKDGLQVIEGRFDDFPGDDREWLHVSMSYPDKLPSYEDMKHVKAVFIGDAYTAYQIFPPKDRHVNIHPNCLHLWVCITEEIMPDFGKEGTI